MSKEMLKVREAEILELKAELKELKNAIADLWIAHTREINKLIQENKH